MKSHKIIIRHLPPTMTEEEFLKQIEPLPDNDYYYYAPADWSLGADATCRAYITVKNYDDILPFRDRFDGYVFVDNRGNEYPAIVEFAPFQGILKNRCRGNEFKVNTIESESHYQDFLKKLEEEREALAKGGEGKLEFNLERKKEEIVSTPLLQYLANKKEKRREEAKRRTTEKKQQRQQKINGKQGDGKNRKDHATMGNNCKGNGNGVKEDNTNGTQSKRRNDRRAERNRRRSEEFKKRLQEQHMKQQQQRQQLQNNDNGSDNDEQDEQNMDKNGSRHNRYDNNRQKDIDKERERKESAATNSDDCQLNCKSEDIITTSYELSDSVRNFIYQATQNIASTITSKDISVIKEEKSDMNNVDDTISDQIMEGQQRSKQVQGRNKMGINGESKPTIPTNTDNDISNHNAHKQQERRDEKRIRNKDRPSIAIYQPKARLRISEENDNCVGTGGDTRSQSTSDCENVVTTKDEQKDHQLQQQFLQQKQQQQSFKHKRVQRYSERTKNRLKNQNIDNDSPVNMESKKAV